MIGLIAKILVALNSNSRPGEMASGLSFGLWLSLVPGGNLLWIILFVVAFFLKHNTAAFLLSLAAFRLIVPLSDPLLDSLGGFVLSQPGFHGFFTGLYNLPLGIYTSFNNTVVAGGFLAGLLLWFPVFMLVRVLIRIYRRYVAPKLAESRPVRFLKRVPILSRLARAIELEGLL